MMGFQSFKSFRRVGKRFDALLSTLSGSEFSGDEGEA